MTHDERDSQLSAMFDGELPEPECELLARRLARDGELRRQWASHALVGAVIRREPLYLRRGAAGMPVSTLPNRVAAALAAEAVTDEAEGATGEVTAAGTTGSPRRLSGAGARPWLRPAVGMGIAAGVAALSIGFMRNVEIPAPGSSVAGLPARSAPMTIAAASDETPVVGSVAAEVAGPVAASVPAPAAADGEVVLAANSLEPESYVVPAQAANPAGVLPAAQLANYVVAHSEYSTPLSRRSVLSALVAHDESQPAATRVAPVPESAGR